MTAWTECLPRRDASGDPEWTLACPHGAVTSEEVKQTYSPNEALGLYTRLCWEMPGGTVKERAMTAIRLLLGRLLGERMGCGCGDLPFQVVFDPETGAEWVEDLS
jgi:hypothetical protein